MEKKSLESLSVKPGTDVPANLCEDGSNHWSCQVLIYTNTNVCCYTDLQIFSDDSITLQYDRRTSPSD